MTTLYKAMMYVVHSRLEIERDEVIITNDTTPETFRNEKVNEDACSLVDNWIRENMEYEVSYSQMMNGINLFLAANKK